MLDKCIMPGIPDFDSSFPALVGDVFWTYCESNSSFVIQINSNGKEALFGFLVVLDPCLLKQLLFPLRQLDAFVVL